MLQKYSKNSLFFQVKGPLQTFLKPYCCFSIYYEILLQLFIVFTMFIIAIIRLNFVCHLDIAIQGNVAFR